MSREDRIQEIMDELGIDHDPAEAMFETDNEDEYEAGTM